MKEADDRSYRSTRDPYDRLRRVSNRPARRVEPNTTLRTNTISSTVRTSSRLPERDPLAVRHAINRLGSINNESEKLAP